MSENNGLPVYFSCPYCSRENTTQINGSGVVRQLVNCDFEEGGCDKEFVVEVKFKAQVDTYKLVKTEVKDGE